MIIYFMFTQSALTSTSPLVRPAVAPIKLAEQKPSVVPQASSSSSSGSSPVPEPAPKKFLGFEALTWAKIVPLGAMFFFILFNYTILRNTKVRVRSA